MSGLKSGYGGDFCGFRPPPKLRWLSVSAARTVSQLHLGFAEGWRSSIAGGLNVAHLSQEGGGCSGMTGPALWLRCTFRGLIDSAYGQAWSGIGGETVGSGMAVLDCDFIATDRGPILQ